ncbi:class I tRNA ligase family protein [Vibrio harveyi]|nr:class I tRNA ligase family protein [Vibrio harveyi]
MSKSLGNVIDPIKIIDTYSSDALRFYIANDLPTEKDGNFSLELFIESFNAHLANNVGNLISRTHNMITKYFNGYIDLNNVEYDQELIDLSIKTIDEYVKNMDQYKISAAIRNVLDLSASCNKYIEDTAP